MNPIHRLTELEQGVLGIERQAWRYTGTKEQAVRERLDVSMTGFTRR